MIERNQIACVLKYIFAFRSNDNSLIEIICGETGAKHTRYACKSLFQAVLQFLKTNKDFNFLLCLASLPLEFFLFQKICISKLCPNGTYLYTKHLESSVKQVCVSASLHVFFWSDTLKQPTDGPISSQLSFYLRKPYIILSRPLNNLSPLIQILRTFHSSFQLNSVPFTRNS